MKRLNLNFTNTFFLGLAHALAIVAVLYMVFIHFSWWTAGLGLLWLALCSISITGGYHRLFAHPTYKAVAPVKLFYLLFGAASAQKSAIKWSADHREHHGMTDEEGDPYNAQKGFWWSHMGWVMAEREHPAAYHLVRDLESDPLVNFQHKYYAPMAIGVGALVPLLIGFAWGDPIGALLCAGFLRLILQWHMTFSINSFAHMLGTQPYSTSTSARDSWITALLTLGEGYHNYHHRFQNDYRNGVRWYHYDPTKWLVWTMSKIGLAKDLRKMPREAIDRAKANVQSRH